MYLVMKVVKVLENEKKEVESQETQTAQTNGYIRIRKFKFVMLIFVLVFATAGVTTFALAFGDDKPVKVAVNQRTEFNKLYDTYDQLKKNYYKDLNNDKLINGAINGMLDSLDDPYSDYMTKEEAAQFHESISSSFQGIGAEIQEKDGYIVVVSPIKGSPAEKIGLKPNDKILAVDGKSIRGMSANEAVLLIRGEKGSKVTLTIQKAGSSESTKITITRDDIPVNTVYSEMLENGVAKIQITSFSENTYNELLNGLKDMESKGMKSLILDLRQNPGGLLDQAIKISNLFVPEGKKIVQIEDKKGKREEFVAEDGKKIDVPVAVIIDNGSASASEILAAAVKESAGIPLVGQKSFGKGTVQSATDFKDGSNMKITTAKWLTPDANWIHQKGIKPDYEVSLPKYADLPIINPDTKIEMSSISSDVKAAEEMLKALGYNPGKVDGFFDQDTEIAVKEFQKKNNLKETGVLQGETTLQLMNQLREDIVKNDTQVKKAISILKK
ncbi:S41 family peptidase [Heyndrickxia oleronia]|nr:S41 family peptidase [Heyndrickxia oleronia]MCM3236716.1 S41 family peptidase [Heyndrickxia oleronia]